jgi:hypothetical protein
MSDRLEILAFRSAAKLPKSDEDQRRMRAMVYEATKDSEAPFDRMIDYWFAAIAWAALHELELPADDSEGRQFVDIGLGPNFIKLEPWRIDVLNALYLLSQPAFLAQSFEPSKINTTAGRVDASGATVGGSEVIKNANRYALAGAMPMWEAFVGGNVDATKAPKQLAAAAKLRAVAQDTGKIFRSTFGSFSDRPREAGVEE